MVFTVINILLFQHNLTQIEDTPKALVFLSIIKFFYHLYYIKYELKGQVTKNDKPDQN